MTSYEFEMAAKKAVVDECKNIGENVIVEQVSIVFFAYTLGNIKATLIDGQQNNRYYEVTYNKARDEMYFDMYAKLLNKKLTSNEFRGE